MSEEQDAKCVNCGWRIPILKSEGHKHDGWCLACIRVDGE